MGDRRGSNQQQQPPAQLKDGRVPSTREVIQGMEQKRQERRAQMEERKAERRAEEKRNAALGVVGDVDFVKMISRWRDEHQCERPHVAGFSGGGAGDEIKICVRKRPIGRREVQRNDHDAVSCVHPTVVVHDCRHRVDGITKYLANTSFTFDHAFDENIGTEEIYRCIGKPLVDFVVRDQARATIFAYGQTGSGKTYTMEGIQRHAAEDVFAALNPEHMVLVSFFEIYGGRCQDLMNERARLQVREDARGEVNVIGLEEVLATTPAELLQTIERGNKLRTTQRTEANDTSSRSHAVCQIAITERKAGGRLVGKLTLVDLAGSERGQDTKSHNRQLRTESAEINKSLLALKECIRGLASNLDHVPFRASKLTMVLRDSFVRPHCRVAMIATVSPSVSSTDHTTNTLRYADRVKEKPNLPQAAQNILNKQVAQEQQSKHSGAERQAEKIPAQAPEPAAALPTAGPRDDNHKNNRRVSSRGTKEKERPPPAPAERRPTQQQQQQQQQQQRDKSPQLKAQNKPHRNSDAAAQREAKHQYENKNNNTDDDISLLHRTLDNKNKQSDEADNNVLELHRTVDSLFEEEEALLNTHMNVIQENAELLTEEGRMLQQVQGGDVVDYDIDTYVTRLQVILDRKAEQISQLQAQLKRFATKLRDEETQSRLVSQMPMW